MNAAAPDSRQPPEHSGRRTFIVSTALAVLGLIVAILAWRFPVGQDSDGSSDQRGQTVTGIDAEPSATQGTAPLSPTPATQVRYLNTITPEEGRRYLAPLPAGLSPTAEYAHAVTIACPSNQTGDTARELRYPLNQRYLAFTGTVTARFAASVSVPDPQVELTSIASERQRDGTLRASANESRRATAGHPSSMTLNVTGAEKLTVRISCEVPNGVVILTDARLTLSP
ncbi:MAG: hypothetical protein IRZ05_19500 [Micromonosporaceae bacterium]|nr:hypothetical protein [Micromonosporaceae bacterium]